MKQFARRSRRLPLLALAAIALLGVACGGIQKPDGWAAPAPVGDRLLVQRDSGQLALVDPATGAAVWQFPAEHEDDRPFYATPLVRGSDVYVVDYRGLVTRLDASGGQPQAVWDLDLEEKVVATPLLQADSLFVATEDGQIHVIDAETGNRSRTISTSERRIWGSPAGSGGAIYVADLDKGVTLAFDAATGERRWEQQISGPSAADLVLDDDLLLVAAFDHRLHALDTAANGEQRWAFEGDGWFMGRPLVEGQTVFAATMRGTVYAVDIESGAQRWAFTATDDAEFRASPILVDGALVAIARDGRVFALDPGTGEVRWSQDVVNEGNVNADPHVDGSDLYLITSRHDLVRVDLGGGAFQAVPLAAAR